LDNKRLFLAALLSLGVLVLWQVVFPAPKPAPPAPTVAPPLAASPSGAPPQAGAVAPVAAAPTAAGVPSAPAGVAALEPIVGAAESREVLESANYRAEFSSRGAQLISFQLLRHNAADGKTLELIRRRAAAPDGAPQWPFPFALVDAAGAPLAVNQKIFAVDRPDANSLRFRYRGPEGDVEKVFRPLADGFEAGLTVAGRTDWGFTLGQGLRNPTADELKSQFGRRMVSWRSGSAVDQADSSSLEPQVIPAAGLSWVALEDNYFISALLPKKPVTASIRALIESPAAAGASGSTFEVAPPKDQLSGDRKKLNREQEVLIYPQADSTEVRTYFGAKSYEVLASLGVGLEKTIRWGTFGFLARPLLLALRWIHDHVVPNYGWSIVLMTFLINILLLPLNHKSYVSMKKMQQLNPRMEAIKEKWRPKLKDKQGRPNLENQRKMQEEVSALFKAEGVSPVGGCLPILLQMPLLFAFYSLLSSAVELRGAPWVGWIHDLAQADPYYILPTVMGATQFLQQRLSPQVGDPVQRRMFQLMPIFFTVLFLGFPAGLVLYWLVSNLFGVGRQLTYNTIQKRAEAK
jgi:YidC/Oxa1 family membrane protein insertase